MKAIILAGGRGKRLDELSTNMNKCMLKINGKQMLEYSLDNAINSNVNEIIVVVGYKAEEIINHYGNSYNGKKIKYIIQSEQNGLVHAIECAKEAIGKDDFMLLLGDEIMQKPRQKEMLDYFNKSGAFVVCGILKVENRELIKKTYAVIKDDNDIIYRLIEKPRKPLNDYMGTGNCVFKNEIFKYIEFTPIHHERHEKELPDLIQCAIDDGKMVKSFIICEKYANINLKDDIDKDYNLG
ncbi:MAG: nucleotidyltransferase family protein [Elusimicrobia bacterium]|nr:nucleotidyltransferase family protein [Elusimicrobiota bacterium]